MAETGPGSKAAPTPPRSRPVPGRGPVAELRRDGLVYALGSIATLLGGGLVLLAPGAWLDPRLLTGWVTGLGLVVTVGLFLAHLVRRPHLSNAEAGALMQAISLHAATEGLLWGMLVFIWTGSPNAAERLALLMVLAAVVAANMLCRDRLPRGAALFTLAALTPSVAWAFLYGAAPERLAALALSLGLVAMLWWLLYPARWRRAQEQDLLQHVDDIERRLSMLDRDLTRARAGEHDAESEVAVMRRRLADAEQGAERALLSQAAFLANMSHEIRTPMNGILGLAELLGQTSLSQKQSRFVEGITSSGEGLLTLINNILDFSKAEAGKLTLDEQTFNLAEMLDETVATFAEAMHRKGVDLVGLCDLDEPHLYRGDVDRLRQVLINLIGNAMKFTSAGEVRVEVGKGDAGRLRFAVTDTGIGIAQESLGRIFESFTQADNSTTRRFGGTGLGLAICRQLIELMGGFIGVDSTLGKGSRFWFELPLKQAAGSAASRLDPAPLAGRRVVVLANPGSTRDVLELQLRRWSMEVVSCAVPEELRTLLKSHRAGSRAPDILIVDEQVAGTPASLLLREFKPLLSLLPTRLLALIGFGNLEETSQWFSAGVHGYLTKPVRHADLLNALLGAVRGDDLLSQRAQAEVASSLPHGARVLVVEDNPVNLELAVSMLDSLKCDAEPATDGREAVARLCRPDPQIDLVLMDCQMPDLDGLEATRMVRAYEAKQRVQRPLRIVALTANALSGDRERCLAAGMDDYLSKPFTRQQLEALLLRWLPPITPAGSAAPLPVEALKAPDTLDSLSTDDSLDMQAVRAILELEKSGRAGLLAKLIAMFRTTAAARLEEMRAAIDASDAARLGRAAHALKSGAAQLGAQLLAGTCRELESMARNDDLDRAASVLQLAQLEYRAASSLLERINSLREQAA